VLQVDRYLTLASPTVRTLRALLQELGVPFADSGQDEDRGLEDLVQALVLQALATRDARSALIALRCSLASRCRGGLAAGLAAAGLRGYWLASSPAGTRRR
jgi:hypothetical protein